MEHGVIEYIQTGFFACLFAISLMFLISSMKSEQQFIATIKEVNESSNKVLYEHTIPEDLSNDIISRNELISRMMHPLDYPVSINGLMFLPENYHYINFDYSSIVAGDYRATTVYDTNGNITSVRYEKI